MFHLINLSYHVLKKLNHIISLPLPFSNQNFFRNFQYDSLNFCNLKEIKEEPFSQKAFDKRKFNFEYADGVYLTIKFVKEHLEEIQTILAQQNFTGFFIPFFCSNKNN